MEHQLGQIVAVIGPRSNGKEIHPAMITGYLEDTANLLDPKVHDGEGMVGRVNVTIFPDLGAPHPAAGLPLFADFGAAKAALAAHAAKGMKFLCAYWPEGEKAHIAEIERVRGALEKHQKHVKQFQDEKAQAKEQESVGDDA